MDPTALSTEMSGLALAREGGTTLLLPEFEPGQKGPARRQVLFYNPAMALSRDLTVALVKEEGRQQGRRLSVWDAHAATGVRGLRLLYETQAVDRLLATDTQPAACLVARENAQREGSGRMEVREHDARIPPGERFDWVDIDPFGTPAPYLSTGIETTEEGGILAVTATDMAVLAGPETRTCETRYGAWPVRGYLAREGALRVLLAALSREARAQGRRVHPMLSFISGYFVRVHVRVTSPSRGPGSEDPIGMVPYPGYDGPPLHQLHPAGPLWLGPIQDPGFVANVRSSLPTSLSPKAVQTLDLIQAESAIERPFYHETGVLSKRLHLASPPSLDTIFAVLRGAGYLAERTHAAPSGWRTSAPLGALESLFRSGSVAADGHLY